MKKQSKKQIDSDIEKAFYVHFDRIQIPIMEIGKIYQHGRDEINKGKTADQAMSELVLKYKGKEN